MSSIPQAEEQKGPGFVFGNTGDSAPNKISEVVEVKSYLVAYTDGAGKKNVRLAFRVPGAKTTFLFQERIQGAYVATEGTDWFNKAMVAALASKGLEKIEGEGPEGAQQV